MIDSFGEFRKKKRWIWFCFIQRLKAALHAACGKICEQLQTQSNVTVDKKVVAAIGDITFQQIGTFCQDLDAFAKYDHLFVFLLGKKWFF